MATLPETFMALHAGEEHVRQLSLEAIAKSEDLSLHFAMTESSADFIYSRIHRDEHKDEDDLTIRLLGMRLFNALNATVKLMLSGYYQASVLHQRDLVETFFLLDYFSTNPSLVTTWRNSDDKALRKNFAPAVARKALDARDGFKQQQREASYKLLSSIAGHANPRGFVMLRLPNGDHHCGPFFDAKALELNLTELGRSAVQAGSNFGKFFDAGIYREDVEIQITFFETQRRWFQKFYGKDIIPQADIDEIKALSMRLPSKT